jgi:hypothetical protein
MAIFGKINSDAYVFTGDKIRITASVILSPDLALHATKNLELSFDSGTTWFDVTTKRYLDWIYSAAGNKTVKLKVTTTTGEEIFTKSVEVLDLTTATLFSTDNDLYALEPEIDQYLPKKWDSWNYLHLEAQKQIVQWLDDKGILNENREKYTVASIMDITQVREFSVNKVLGMIFRTSSNQVGDLFSVKATYYEEQANLKAAKAQIRLDYNDNGVADDGEMTNLFVVNVIRR